MRPCRRPALATLALVLAACGSACGSAPPEASGPVPAAGEAPVWTLAWSDEFDGAAGAPVSDTRWVADTGGTGWGNREREYYTPGVENAALDGAGHLAITARVERADSPRHCWYGTCRYTS